MKIIDYYDDLVFCIRRTFNEYYFGIKRWISCFKTILDINNYDYTSVLILEKYQLTKLRNTINKYKGHLDYKRDVERIDLAINLIDIILEDGCCIYPDFKIESCEDNLYRVSHESKCFLPVYVNTNNYNRFFKKLASNIQFKNPTLKDQLRIEKAWNLYHELRKSFMRTWWD